VLLNGSLCALGVEWVVRAREPGSFDAPPDAPVPLPPTTGNMTLREDRNKSGMRKTAQCIRDRGRERADGERSKGVRVGGTFCGALRVK